MRWKPTDHYYEKTRVFNLYMTTSSNTDVFGNLFGTTIFGQGQSLSNGTITGAQNAAQQNAAQQSAMHNSMRQSNSPNKRIFTGNIEVSQVANGYVINIATKEGYLYTTHIAHTIVEVNEIIAAAMVAFQLESK
jgi:hypothetical protein